MLTFTGKYITYSYKLSQMLIKILINIKLIFEKNGHALICHFFH